MSQAKIGIIGGSGLYQIEGMSDIEVINVSTPFGNPSDLITIGTVEDVPMAFLPRHSDKGQWHESAREQVTQNAPLIMAIGSYRPLLICRSEVCFCST